MITEDERLLIRLDERISAMKETLEQVLVETKKTNGRVKAIEIWKAQIKGGWTATAIIAGFIGSGLGVLIAKFL